MRIEAVGGSRLNCALGEAEAARRSHGEAGGEGSVEVWDVAGGEEAFVVQTSAGEPWFAWSPDGERLAVSDGAEGRLAILDRSGRELTHTSFSNGWVGHVAFTPGTSSRFWRLN